MDICHHCDNRACVKPGHLFLGTRLDNVRDCQAKGRFRYPPRTKGDAHHARKYPERIPKGSQRAGSKLNEMAAVEIFKRAASGESHKTMAQQFGVSPRCIGLVARGKTWKHVNPHGGPSVPPDGPQGRS